MIKIPEVAEKISFPVWLTQCPPFLPITLPRNKPLATLLRGKRGFFFGQTGGFERGIGVSAWGERTYADAPNVGWSGKLVFFCFFSA